ncbi:MAG TPA: aminodeoxychorismate synthase component I [Mycobacteriales bacterium]|nr:aminodeoxychorismate synthase component I [Mycobacteriales bacterium]
MRTLLVDNYDSYTYNLYQLIATVTGVEPLVLRNDAAEWDDLDLSGVDGVVISPGPGHPGRARDLGRCAELLRRPDLPVLGVCLGHQAIGLLAGARVRPAARPRHGAVSVIRHAGSGLFAGLPPDFTAVRYHSLCVAEPLPAALAPLAWAEDGVLMALAHRHRPQWGVQFHPESVATEHGATLLGNFRDLALAHRRRTTPPVPAPAHRPAVPAAAVPAAAVPAAAARPATAPPTLTAQPTVTAEPTVTAQPTEPARAAVELRVLELPVAVDAERVFGALYRDSPSTFWLDSSRVHNGLSRFSFLGDAGGPLAEVLTYRVGAGAVDVWPARGPARREPGTIFDVLADRLRALEFRRPPLPFDLTCGYVGYFGYELKADCGGTAAHRAGTPDAVWLLADRMIAIDHLDNRTYLLALDDTAASPDPGTSTTRPPASTAPAGTAAAGGTGTAQEWLRRTADRLRALPAGPLPHPEPPRRLAELPVRQLLRRGPDRYIADIAECQRQLHAGESYEICLTDAAVLPAPADPVEAYRWLRRANPAPYAALFRHGELTVASSSPERFLRIGADRTVESRPVKGTAPRGADPAADAALRRALAADAKTRAENLMIVDLLRNDLGRVCEIGSVTVPRLMATETYATVHQLVSTVHGRLRAGVGPIDCVRAAFPGGSMTGAPKLRTMEIIDRLENRARGVYSGALGWFGPGGTADLSIVIRTLVSWRGAATVGAGGAIVLDSKPADEYAEMLLKAGAVLQGLVPDGQETDTTGTPEPSVGRNVGARW